MLSTGNGLSWAPYQKLSINLYKVHGPFLSAQRIRYQGMRPLLYKVPVFADSYPFSGCNCFKHWWFTSISSLVIIIIQSMSCALFPNYFKQITDELFSHINNVLLPIKFLCLAGSSCFDSQGGKELKWCMGWRI